MSFGDGSVLPYSEPKKKKKSPDPVKQIEEIIKKEDQAAEKIEVDQENFVQKDLQDATRATKRGRRSTILTGPRGIGSTIGANSSRKTLLGE